MVILVLNCGSSSIKYQLVDMNAENSKVLAKGLVERVGMNDAILTHKPGGKDAYVQVTAIADHSVGINLILESLTHKTHGVIDSLQAIEAVGHRVAHGGEFFTESVLLDSQGKKNIETLCELAPLHNPANLKGIDAMEKLLPGIPQVCVFDTSFHQTMPPKAFTYGIPYDYYEKYRIRRYGFHGTSHRFVAEKACQLLEVDYNRQKIVTCHLGNGASITAIENGRSVDTSMGFTPEDGLMMGTRCGDVDAGILLFLAEKENLDNKHLNALVNKQSGVLGVSGVSSDMRDVENAARNGNKRAQLALDMYYYRVKKYIGAYAAVMNGIDILVFTGGIGENDFMLRQKVCENMQYLGLEIDSRINDGLRGQDTILSTKKSKVKVMLITTNEEFVIASDTMRIVSSINK